MSIFSHIQATKPNSNIFDLSHNRKFAFKMGNLTPTLVLECVPGDKISMSTSQMLRMAPMITPPMHQISVYTHFFFVPNRILWPNWEQFITGGEDGKDESVFPYLEYVPTDFDVGSLADYLGLPVNITGDETSPLDVSAIPINAYLKIFDEYYRDQNLFPTYWQPLDDGDNGGGSYMAALEGEPFPRAWQHDYFTSALPWTQKGAEATIPLGTTAPVVWDFNQIDELTVTNQKLYDNTGAQYTSPSNLETYDHVGTGNDWGLTGDNSGTITPLHLDVSKDHSVDLSSATASTINDLRNAFRLQEWLEKNARGGSRYIESILSHFGVKSSDARLQRPEFLGGGSSPVTISEVLQTSDAAAAETPQGNMAGHGISVGANHQFSHYCEEHGYIIGIISVMPKTGYMQGLPKHYTKFDKFDYYWPSFANLGEQPILNQELFIDSDGQNEDVFGYTPRYAEYKYMNSSTHGTMKTSLDIWHMDRKFDERPYLNAEFISCIPTTRIFAVEESTEQLYCHLFHRIKAKRLMPYFGTPKGI